MIRVTVQFAIGNPKTREYADAVQARDWLLDEGFFGRDNVREIVWLSVPECEHRWTANGSDENYAYFECSNCGRDVFLEHGTVSRIARIKQR